MNIQNTQTSSPTPSQPVPPPTITPSKAHFLHLPVEIRLRIIYHALLPPPPRNNPSCDLLLVNRQVHAEAEDVLYSNFRFCFPHYLNAALVRDFLGGVGPRTVQLIRKVDVLAIFRTGNGDGGYAVKQRREAFETLIRELPRLSSVVVAVSFTRSPVEESRMKELVDAVLGLVRVFSGVESLELVHGGSPIGQRGDIVRECRERVRAGEW